jgi:hypothetical protein
MRAPNPLTVAVLADVVAAAGGRWTGSASALQAAMISAAGPGRRRGVPLTTGTLSAALDALAAAVDPEDEEAPLRVTRSPRHGWHLSSGPVHEADVLRSFRSDSDGAVLVHARCRRCGRDVLHGAGDDPERLVLGHRETHCGCPGGYVLVTEAAR